MNALQRTLRPEVGEVPLTMGSWGIRHATHQWCAVTYDHSIATCGLFVTTPVAPTAEHLCGGTGELSARDQQELADFRTYLELSNRFNRRTGKRVSLTDTQLIAAFAAGREQQSRLDAPHADWRTEEKRQELIAAAMRSAFDEAAPR